MSGPSLRFNSAVACMLFLSFGLAACDPSGKDVSDTASIPTDPGTVSGYAGATARSMDRGWRLVEVAKQAPVADAPVANVQQ